jgi:spore cortex formation protein SpoVR/YcgB (stage V sporulation)
MVEIMTKADVERWNSMSAKEKKAEQDEAALLKQLAAVRKIKADNAFIKRFHKSLSLKF